MYEATVLVEAFCYSVLDELRPSINGVPSAGIGFIRALYATLSVRGQFLDQALAQLLRCKGEGATLRPVAFNDKRVVRLAGDGLGLVCGTRKSGHVKFSFRPIGIELLKTKMACETLLSCFTLRATSGPEGSEYNRPSVIGYSELECYRFQSALLAWRNRQLYFVDAGGDEDHDVDMDAWIEIADDFNVGDIELR